MEGMDSEKAVLQKVIDLCHELMKEGSSDPRPEEKSKQPAKPFEKKPAEDME